MASLVLGAAGAFIGSFFGPLGASIGWAIGSAIGAGIGQKGTEGPRLTDLKLQTSAYGSVIPVLYGTVRVAGASVIWQTDLVEHKATSGGKGGNRQTTTTYSYSASFAILLCNTSFIDEAGALVVNPILGIKRIWADNRLIYNNGTRVGGTTELPMTIYYGTDTQNPDPTIEAALGAGNVPAHRGYAYVVFTDLALGEFFNRIPNLQFEIHATGAVLLQEYATWDVDWELHGDHSTYSYPNKLSGQSYDPATKILTAYRWRSADDYGGATGAISLETRTYTLQGTAISTSSGGFTIPGCVTIDILSCMNSVHFIRNFQFTTSCYACNGFLPPVDLNTSEWNPVAPNVGWPQCVLCFHVVAGLPVGLSLGINGSMFYHSGFIYATGGGFTDDPHFGGPGIWVERWPLNTDGEISQQGPDATYLLRPTVSGPTPPIIDPKSAEVTVSDDGFVYVIASDSTDGVNLMWKLTRDLQLVYEWNPLPFDYVPGLKTFTVFQNMILVQANSGGTPLPSTILFPGIFLYKFNDDLAHSFTLVDHLFGTAVTPDGFPSAMIPLSDGFVAWRAGILSLGGDTTYADIVTDISLRCGLTTADIDVTDIPEVCHGFVIGQQMTGRAAIEALMPADIFDATESDLKAKFVKRGLHPSLGQIPDADLGARPTQANPIPLLEIKRIDESQLPRRIYVKYFNIGADYQDGTQIAQRTVTSSRLDVTLNLPVCLYDDEAKYIAESLLASAWAERDSFIFATPMKWSYLDPTDTISPRQFAMRITQQSIENQVVKYEAAATIDSVYISQPVAVPPQIVPQPQPVSVQPTDVLLMDLPLVADLDSANGWYAGMQGRVSASTWPGAQLEQSSDGGANYAALFTSTSPNIIGYTADRLPDWTGGNFFDESSVVDVVIGNGSPAGLSSATELAVLNGANLCVIGDELVQFKNASLVSTNRYQLSGLLRGRRGTEWAQTGHIGNERFCMLPALNIMGAYADLGASFLYKAVTSGAPLSSATAQTFSNNGIALQPYSPCHLGGGRNTAGDIILKWTRRTRIGGAWLNFVDVPLSETAESYQVNFYTDGTYTSNPYSVNPINQVYILTAADQVAFLGGLQNPLYWGVQQFGSYQPGYESRAAT